MSQHKDVSVLEETLITISTIGYNNTINGLRMLRYDTSHVKNIEPIIIDEILSYYGIPNQEKLFTRKARIDNTDAICIYCALMQKYTKLTLGKMRSRINKDRSVISRYRKRVFDANPDNPADAEIHKAFTYLDNRIKAHLNQII